MKITLGGFGYQRGDIVGVIIRAEEKAGHEQKESRPAVVVQNDASNRALETTIVVPLTDARNIRKLGPNHVFLKAKADGVDIDSVVLCHQITTIDTARRIAARIGCLPKTKMAEIDAALKITLDLS